MLWRTGTPFRQGSWVGGFPELIDISYRPPDDGQLPELQPVYEVEGEAVAVMTMIPTPSPMSF
jgi:hypothetical protein